MAAVTPPVPPNPAPADLSRPAPPGQATPALAEVLASLGVGASAGVMLPTLEPALDGLSAPLLVEIETGQPRRGQQGLFRLRATTRGNQPEAVLEIVAESGLWNRPARLSARLAWGETHDFPALTFVPTLAGSEEVRLRVTLADVTGIPLGRWTANHVLTIEETPAGPGSGAIQAGGDVFVLGAAAGPSIFPGLPAPPSWQPLILRTDRNFQQRLAAACPEVSALPPPLPPVTDGPALALIRLTHEPSGRTRVVAVACATSASFGRGGDPAVAWWLRPAPYDLRQHQRLSRQHCLLELRQGRAWVTDRSTNGTWLDGERLADRPELLADGSRLGVAENAVPLRVSLAASAGRVHAIWLEREDSLAGRLSYLLSDCRSPLLLSGVHEPLWLSWARSTTGSTELVLSTSASGGWLAVGAELEQRVPPDWRVGWRPLPAPIDQEEYLRHRRRADPCRPRGVRS